jgi:hypothetical protein
MNVGQPTVRNNIVRSWSKRIVVPFDFDIVAISYFEAGSNRAGHWHLIVGFEAGSYKDENLDHGVEIGIRNATGENQATKKRGAVSSIVDMDVSSF